MHGAQYLHGDETSWSGLVLEPDEPECLCDGCEEDGLYLKRVGKDWYCEDCLDNMTCSVCNDYQESVDRAQGKSVCEGCLENEQ